VPCRGAHSLEQFRQAIQKPPCRRPSGIDERFQAGDQLIAPSGIVEDFAMVGQEETDHLNKPDYFTGRN